MLAEGEGLTGDVYRTGSLCVSDPPGKERNKRPRMGKGRGEKEREGYDLAPPLTKF